MKNKEVLNICYKYLNRFINAIELVEYLSNIDTEKYSKKDKKEINNLIIDIKKLMDKYPNYEDELVINEKNKIEKMISKIVKIPSKIDDDKTKNYINKHIKSLNDDYKKVVDSEKRWLAISECITTNNYFNYVFDNLDDYELLEFIAQYISAPFPPNFTQEEFNRLVKVGIENDEREWLWRLAFNYEKRDINFDLIVDYFIDKKDDYYIAELVSAVGECLNIDKIIDKINDKDLIRELRDRKNVLDSYFTDEQYNRLIDKLNK